MRRFKIQIFYDMLSVVNRLGKAKPTHILYKANLSYKRFADYLATLKEKQFVSETVEKGSTYYTITDKGRKFLQDYSQLRQMSDAFGLPVF